MRLLLVEGHITELFGTLPWHTWFSNEISRDIYPKGDGCPEMERNIAVEVCDYDGRHVCWAKSLEHAKFIVNAVNHLHRARTERTLPPTLGENAYDGHFEHDIYGGESPSGMNTDSVICKESVQRFLKDGETVEQCLVRNRRDIDTLLGLLAKEREKSDIVRPYESPRWRDVADEPPQKAQEVLFVHDGKTVHGAWIGGAFWHNNQRCSAATWLPLPMPPKPCLSGELKYSEEWP